MCLLFALTFCMAGYRRTVLLLVHEDNTISTLSTSVGQYYFYKLRNSTTSTQHPTAHDKELARYIIQSLNPKQLRTAKEMSKYVLNWRDLDLWKDLVKRLDSKLVAIGEDMTNLAWTLFSFNGILPV